MRKATSILFTLVFLSGVSTAALSMGHGMMHQGQGMRTAQNMGQQQGMHYRYDGMRGHHSGRMMGGPGNSSHMMERGSRPLEMFTYLNLTPEQQQKMNELMQQVNTLTLGISVADRDIMHKLMSSESFDETAVKQQVEKMSQSQVEYRVAKAKLHNQMYNLLTTDQKALFNQYYDSRMAIHNQFQGNR